MVPEIEEVNDTSTSKNTEKQKTPNSTIRPGMSSPSLPQTQNAVMLAVNQKFETYKIPERTKEIMLNFCRGSTLKHYAVYIKKWNHFLQERNYNNDLNPPVTCILGFLSQLYDTECGYNAFNTARSALSYVVICYPQ